MDFKEYFKQITGENEFSITGLRFFIYLTNKGLDRMKKHLKNQKIFIKSNNEENQNINENLTIKFLKKQIYKMKKILDIAVQEILNFNYGVLELENLLGQELFNEIYTEEKFNENKVKMAIENAEECNQCNE